VSFRDLLKQLSPNEVDNKLQTLSTHLPLFIRSRIMRIHHSGYGTTTSQQGLQETARQQQKTPVLSTSTRALLQTRDSFAPGVGATQSLKGASSATGFFNSSASPLQSRPLDVFGGALMASGRQTGLRSNLEQFQTQLITAILEMALREMVTQLARILGSGAQVPGGGYPGPTPPPYGTPSYPPPGGTVPPPGGTVPPSDLPVGYAPSGTLPVPADRSEFASYVSAATRQGKGQNGNIAQKDALAGTRFAQVVDSKLFDAALARGYAYQFASAAKGFSTSTPNGLADGANAFYRMSPDAQAFMQVASIYKGDLEGGAKNYDNGKLKGLLARAGYDGANRPGVGKTDIETLGAVADALDKGVISLNDVMQSGAIKDMGKYRKVIDYVQSGKFAQTLAQYDSTPFQGGGNGGSAGNAGNGGAAGNAGNGGSAGNAGNGGSAGNAGNGGSAGNAGNGGSAGNAGNGGSAGTAGNGGSAGSAGGVSYGGGGNGTTLGGVDGFYRDVLDAKNAGVGGISTGVRYQDLSNGERNAASGMDERQRAVLHLWGIQMGSAGHQDGGVVLNVLNNPEKFKPAEVALAKEIAAKEQAQYGGITGKSLDNEFFGLYENLTGKDISQRYGNAPIRYARGPVNMDNRLTGGNGLNQFENEVLQLWGHSPLYNGGKIDGSILNYALNSNNRMEVNLNPQHLEMLRDADMASDGVFNGDSLENAMVDVLDRVYLGAPSATPQRTMNDALEEASQRRLGLLPPPKQATPSAPIGTVGQPPRTGGSCPFLGQAPAPTTQPYQAAA
jgi:hypothetical protein